MRTVQEVGPVFQGLELGLGVRVVIADVGSGVRLGDAEVGEQERDRFGGHRRAEADLGISRKVLTERLNHLVEQGVLERRQYDARPRFEYHLADKGVELVDLLMVMVGWGDRWLAGEAGPPVLYRHHACGQVSRVDLRCATCGEPMHAGDVDLLPGPGTFR